jgi:hypothetical protein
VDLYDHVVLDIIGTMGKRISFRRGEAKLGDSMESGEGDDLSRLSVEGGAEVRGLQSAASPAKIQRAEAEGALLIAHHWLAALGDMGKNCASHDILDRLAESVLKVIAKGWGPHGPRTFEVKRFNKPIRRVPLDKENTLLMRYKAGFLSYTNLEGNAHKIVVEPFHPKEYIRKPRHATHYRFFQTIGVLCDFMYQPSVGAYVPVRPDLLGISSITFSPVLEIHQPVEENVELEDVLPGFPELDAHCELMVGVGVEFLHYGKGKLAPRVEMRVMAVI